MSLPNPYIYDPEYYRNSLPYYEPTSGGGPQRDNLAIDHTRSTGSIQYSRADVNLLFDNSKMDPSHITDIQVVLENGDILECSSVEKIPTDRFIKEIRFRVSEEIHPIWQTY